jgi:transaldolase
MDIQRIPMDKATFDKMHAENRMAHDKLDEGIKGFTKALESLETLLCRRLARLDAGQKVGHAGAEIFRLYDLDGDGFITREEWLGKEAIFDVLDEDRDGKVSPEQFSAALGGVVSVAAGQSA